jgi:long-chain acyl-CoA synthetase
MDMTSFWKLAAASPSRPALVLPDGGERTAGELLAAANRIVHGLRALGLRPGDSVATVLPNGAAMIEVCLATSQAGFYLTPINHHLAAPEIAYILGDSESRAILCDARYAEVAGRAAREVGLPAAACFVVGAAPGFRPFEELGAGQPDTTPDERRAGLVMNYTSGTTGRPKGVRRPVPPVDADTIAGSYAAFLALFGIQPGGDNVHLVVAPLYHTAVLNFCMNHVHWGHKVVLMDGWTPEGTLELIARHRVTASHMVPTHFHRLLALPDEVRARHDVSSLRHVIHSAAPCPVDTKRRMLEWWGPVIYEYYAASEGGGTLATPSEWLAHPGTVGRPWPISQIRVLDEEGRPCAPGQVGTVYIRMANYEFEYHKDRPKTEAARKDGFFTVGDAGYLDAEGYLYLCDRKADMIISGGVNIYPAEIEAVLLAHPRVADAAVFGVPDEDWGEQVKAVIELAPGAAPGPDAVGDILAFCRERLAGYKCPRTVDFAQALPRDPNGKLRKRVLRDPYWQGRDRAI